MFRNFPLLFLVLIFRRLSFIVKVNAVQFVGNLARVTFSSASDRDAVTRIESVHVGDVDCVVCGALQFFG